MSDDATNIHGTALIQGAFILQLNPPMTSSRVAWARSCETSCYGMI